ncbi:MAG: T9SS type A sorting domain-containing protein [Bacteroidales bacterium]|nr:T9SS type A sorting domain-containing protein [Bacteroidales bacterium]
MKKGLFLFVLMAISAMTFAQTQHASEWTNILSNRPETFRTQLVSSSEHSIKVNVQVPGFFTSNVATPRGEAKIISLPESISTAKAGEPNIPMMGIPVMIGDKARMSTRIVDAQYMDFENIEVAPSKGDFSRQIDPSTVPYTYGECYNQDAFFPSSNLNLYEPYIIRDFRGQNMAVYPFAYNPVTKTLRVYYNMTVEMYKMDDNGANVIERRRSNMVKMDPDFKSVYQRHFINYEAGMSKYTPVDEEGDLLIICYDDFISAMTDFVNWKKTRGVNTTIVGTTAAGSTYSAIKTYIQNQYNANNNLTHVLLVGDVAQIPGYSYSGGGSSYSGLGDNAYGQIVGSDIYNDVFIGRFSASSTAQVTTQVNRVLTYERDLTTSATWCQNGLGISASAGDGGHYNEDDYEHVENLRTDLLNFGYSTVYQDYESVSGYPSSTTTTISNHINSGVGIINYCNHGQETGWQSHYYMNSNVNALTNNNKLPFIFSVACLVGKYDYASGDCFAETWMHATNSSTPTGAIGGYFSYISQPWIPPMWAQDEFVDILVESYSNNIKHTLGGVGVNSLFAIFDNYSTSESAAVGTYQAWVLYGDPTLMLRTKTPQAMTVTHSGDLPLGTYSYSVSVSNGNGTVATITDANHNILGKATVSNNSATINITGGNLTPNQELTLCVFGYNKVTYLGTITVTGGTQYDITVTQPQHGTISVPTQAYAGTTVTLTATPETGYCLSSWTVKDGNNQNIPVTNNQFTMPESNVTVTATFVQGIAITLAPVTNGSISADPLYALQGMTVNLTATPANGYELGSWLVYKTGDANTTVTVNGDSFIMPNYPVTVSASFVLGPTDLTVYDGTATNQYIPMYGYYFDDYTKSECIIPASQLTAMNGCAVSAITFYPSSVATTNSTWSNTSQTVFLKEVSGTTLGGSFSGTSGATIVKQGLLEMPTEGTAYTITFDTPYNYNGGNLLIGVYNTDDGSYNKVIWYGTSNQTSGVSAYGNNGSSLNSVGYNAQSFLPKTTFTYMPTITPYISLAPNSATIITGFTETLTATYGNVSGTPSITYTSNNTSVATVSGSGTTVTVTAVAPGTATITASMTVEGIPYTATCAVTVEDPSYCTPNPTSIDGKGITTLTFGSGDYVVNNSNSNGLPSSSPYYGDYTSMVGGYEAGETATVTITYSTGTSTVYSYGTVIWLDWNKNYTFEDSEIVYTGTSAQGSNGTPQVLTATFTVPDSQAADDYRMRIAGADSYFDSYIGGTASANHDPCFTSTWAVCHDYTLRVVATTTDPVAITVSADPGNGGIVTGAGTYDSGTTATLTATANAGYTFVNWTKNDLEVSTDATYSFIVTEGGSYVAHFTESIEEQTVVLPIGWSWWSTNVEITLQDLENALSTNGASIVSQNGSVAYLEGLGWDGTITELDLSQMYELNMTGSIELTVSNVLADPADHPITLNPNGYTWIGYPVQQSMNVSDALADLDAEIGDLIKSKSSMAMYMGNNWIGTLNSLEPGHGYMYKSNATTTKTFTYPSNRSGEVKANIIGEGNYWTPEMSRFANNMNMLAVVEFDGAEAMDDNIEVGAFVGDECRGSVRLMRVEETGRYMAFLTIHGETGELVRFRVLNNNGECNVNETIELHINAMVGDLKTPYVLHVGGNSMVLFPNPVAKSEAFRVEMPSNSELNGARVEIFNALGTLVRTETLTGKDVSLVGMTTAGVYTVKVTDRNGNVNFSKLVVE